MSQEEKQLLLVDLSARLPYGVACQIYDPQQDYGEDIFDARLIHIDAWTSHCYFWGCSETDPYKIEQVKPYLRPMLSMTEEEKEELFNLSTMGNAGVNTCWESFGVEIISTHPRYGDHYSTDYKVIDWLNKKMFDYRGLIEKGLAIEAPEGMYNITK